VLERAPYAALYSRIQVGVHLTSVLELERERFVQLIDHVLNAAGCSRSPASISVASHNPSCRDERQSISRSRSFETV
jgi:hypothetical protein